MGIQQFDEALTVCGLAHVKHFVHDDVLQQVFPFPDQFRVEPDVARSRIAATPLRLHPLQEVRGDANVQPRLPLANECGHRA